MIIFADAMVIPELKLDCPLSIGLTTDTDITFYAEFREFDDALKNNGHLASLNQYLRDAEAIKTGLPLFDMTWQNDRTPYHSISIDDRCPNLYYLYSIVLKAYKDHIAFELEKWVKRLIGHTDHKIEVRATSAAYECLKNVIPKCVPIIHDGNLTSSKIQQMISTVFPNSGVTIPSLDSAIRMKKFYTATFKYDG